MPFDCRYRQQHGADACLTACPAATAPGGLSFVRVGSDGGVPPPEDGIVDVALLDMHHGWPNLGHDALVHAVQNIVCDLQPVLAPAKISVRVISYDVRSARHIPEPPGGRHRIYVGTGGPGHLDPARNDGVNPGSQGIREDPSWEPRLFDLFAAIRADEHASLLAVCHTFGVMCRWLGVGDVVLRGPAKGGKSSGIVDNVLTDAALAHPWFARFARALPDHRHFPVLDNRLYDIVPRTALPRDVVALAFEASGNGVEYGDALTMIEAARGRDGVVPRILGVNHHPEIVNRDRQLTILKKRAERGEVTDDWVRERMQTLTQDIDDDGDRSLRLTSSYTLFAPLRHHLQREVWDRAERLGRRLDVDVRDWPVTEHRHKH